eukprot:13583883-Alexandrium_andersonii.AAC.1
MINETTQSFPLSHYTIRGRPPQPSASPHERTIQLQVRAMCRGALRVVHGFLCWNCVGVAPTAQMILLQVVVG